MPAVGSPETCLRRHDSVDRVEKTPGFVDDIREPFVMSIREISLEGSWLDGIDGQNRKQERMTAERFLVQPHNAASGFLDCLCSFRGSSCRLLEPALGRAEALRSGLGFPGRPAGWSTLDHGRDSILVPDGLPLITDHSHHDRALTARAHRVARIGTAERGCGKTPKSSD